MGPIILLTLLQLQQLLLLCYLLHRREIQFRSTGILFFNLSRAHIHSHLYVHMCVYAYVGFFVYVCVPKRVCRVRLDDTPLPYFGEISNQYKNNLLKLAVWLGRGEGKSDCPG